MAYDDGDDDDEFIDMTYIHPPLLEAITSNNDLHSMLQNLALKVGFHYPSSRAEFTGRVDGPRTRVVETDLNTAHSACRWVMDRCLWYA